MLIWPARRGQSTILAALLLSCGGSTSDPDPDPCLDQGVCAPTHPAGRNDTTFGVTGTPFGIDVSEAGQVYVTKLHQVSVGFATIPLSDSVRSSFPTGDIPTDVGFVPGQAKAYVTNQGANNVGVINTATNTQTSLLPLGALPYRVLSTSGNRTYVTFGASKLKVLNSTTAAVIDSIAVPGGNNGLVLSPNGATLYLSHTGGQIFLVSTASLAVIDSFVVGGTPQDIAVSPDGRTLYVANEGLGVQRVDLTTETVTGTLAVPAFAMRLTPDGVQLWVAGSGTVTVIDRAAFTAEPGIPVGGTARRIVFGRNGRMALVANEGGYISVIR